MKKTIIFSIGILFSLCLAAQKKAGVVPVKTVTATGSSTLTALNQGTWMYGNFSTKEYWSKNPDTYLGNAFTMAIAFVFKPDGTYEQYFTSQATDYAGATYHQSLTKGTYTADETTKTITAKALSSHYKRTRNGAVQEDRDMRPDEIAKTDVYTYAMATESNGTPSLSLTIRGTQSTLKFLRKNF